MPSAFVHGNSSWQQFNLSTCTGYAIKKTRATTPVKLASLQIIFKYFYQDILPK